MASLVWQHFACQFGVSGIMLSSISSAFSSWILSAPGGRNDHLRCILLALVLWSLWKARNNAHFRNESVLAQRVISGVQSLIDPLVDAGVLQQKHMRGDMDFPIVVRMKRCNLVSRVSAIAWVKPGHPMILPLDSILMPV